MQEIDPQSLHAALERGQQPLLLDVREAWEYAHAHLPGSVHIPMGEIPARHGELPAEGPIVVLCHHGVRSLQVAHFLEQRGFAGVYNLRGGIDAWSLEVDPDVPRY
jgi:rhodanese-related sulfurtransferase